SSAGKRVKLECDRRRQRTRINIGPAFEKWKMLRESLSMKTDLQLASFLLESLQPQTKRSEKTGNETVCVLKRTAAWN
uniref:Uncharacterized protein n=1 Tax=Nothobranchius furzeri TaxID=105023 RepID=A0A8C6PPU3_NOTFU